VADKTVRHESGSSERGGYSAGNKTAAQLKPPPAAVSKKAAVKEKS
jgi:hypothetical protein